MEGGYGGVEKRGRERRPSFPRFPHLLHLQNPSLKDAETRPERDRENSTMLPPSHPLSISRGNVQRENKKRSEGRMWRALWRVLAAIAGIPRGPDKKISVYLYT